MSDRSDPPVAEHYFTEEPTSSPERRTITVELAGRPVHLETAAGVYSPDRLDPGTAVFLREVPAPPPTGRFLDVGCGWGPMVLTLGLLSPEADLYAVDVNSRALALAASNAERAGVRVTLARPADLPDTMRFDLIWSNPPIHIGKPALHELLQTWLPRLADGGEAYLVVGKNLGADSLQRWIESELGQPCRRIASAKGFRILRIGTAAR